MIFELICIYLLFLIVGINILLKTIGKWRTRSGEYRGHGRWKFDLIHKPCYKIWIETIITDWVREVGIIEGDQTGKNYRMYGGRCPKCPKCGEMAPPIATLLRKEKNLRRVAAVIAAIATLIIYFYLFH